MPAYRICGTKQLQLPSWVASQLHSSTQRVSVAAPNANACGIISNMALHKYFGLVECFTGSTADLSVCLAASLAGWLAALLPCCLAGRLAGLDDSLICCQLAYNWRLMDGVLHCWDILRAWSCAKRKFLVRVPFTFSMVIILITSRQTLIWTFMCQRPAVYSLSPTWSLFKTCFINSI